jgi:hypothetical protein
MQKFVGICFATFGTLFLAGCAAVPDRVEIEVECPPGENECGVTGTIIYDIEKSTGGGGKSMTGFDAALAEIDFSGSSAGVSVTSNSGFAVVTVTSSTGQVNSNSFAWSRIGDSIFLNSPGSLDTWLGSYFADAQAIDIDYGSVEITESAGVNALVAESVYDNQVQAGDAASWYVNGGGGGGGGGSVQPQ